MKGIEMELPEITQKPLENVDMTPDDMLPIRILRAYLDNCKCKWVVAGLPDNVKAMYDAMNEHQDKRAGILKKAIQRLS